MTGKRASVLAWIKTAALNHSNRHIFYHPTLCLKKKNQFLLRMTLMKQKIVLISWNVKPWLYLFLIFSVTKWELHIKSVHCILKDDVVWRKNTSVIEVWDKISQCFCKTRVLFERVTNRQTMVIMRIWVFGRHFIGNEWSKPDALKENNCQSVLSMMKFGFSCAY